MLSDEVIEKVTERLLNRIEQTNEYILKTIGESIKKIGTLTPTNAQRLGNIIKYGGSYDKIVKRLAQTTKLNIKDVYAIFEEVSKSDYQFAKQFYEYRNKKFIPYKDNIALKNQVEALSRITAQEYINFTKTTSVGLGLIDKDGTITIKQLKKAYYDLLDEAVLSISQGKETFQEAMTRQLEQIGDSGVRVIFPSTYMSKDSKGRLIEKNKTMRLDSAIRMQLKDALANLHTKNQEMIGEEIEADGMEITTHSYPAEDHELAQGRQFSIKEFNKLQSDGYATTYDGIQIDLHRQLKSGEPTKTFRPITKLNCYHKVISIVLGVSKPLHTNEELQKIIDNNEKGFEFEGNKYTLYEGSQLQRQIELEIRKQKEKQMLGKSINSEKMIFKSQEKIRQLTQKYKELSKASGLPTKVDRMKVIGYKRVALNK